MRRMQIEEGRESSHVTPANMNQAKSLGKKLDRSSPARSALRRKLLHQRCIRLRGPGPCDQTWTVSGAAGSCGHTLRRQTHQEKCQGLQSQVNGQARADIHNAIGGGGHFLKQTMFHELDRQEPLSSYEFIMFPCFQMFPGSTQCLSGLSPSFLCSACAVLQWPKPVYGCQHAVERVLKGWRGSI